MPNWLKAGFVMVVVFVLSLLWGLEEKIAGPLSMVIYFLILKAEEIHDELKAIRKNQEIEKTS